MKNARLILGLGFAIGMLVAAPAARAACGPPACPGLPIDSKAAFLELPGAVQVTDRLNALAAGPFAARTAYYGGGWDSYQYGSIFFRSDVTRRSWRAFEDRPGRVTYLDAERSCSRTVTKAHPNTLEADTKATWQCRPRRASDIDGATWLRAWLPAAMWPEAFRAGSYIDTTGKAAESDVGTGLMFGFNGYTVSYSFTASGIDVGRVISAYEMDETSADVTTADVPTLPAMSRFKTKAQGGG